MAVGRLSVELELRDGQFTARFRSATNAVNQFGASVGNIDARIRRAESSLSGFLPRLRDIAIVALSARTVLHGLNDTVGNFVGGIIKANAEVERFNTLLQGINKAETVDGRMRAAAEEMEFLFSTAQRAPFALKELSNSFVKMKAAGLENVEGKLTSLTNAIARFGGSEEVLHRATIAIQQMASKGVVSMEELRQQLGEAVPNAMNLMADGLGMTMQDMIKAISEGRVRAVPAIEAMMTEMDRTMLGAGQNMMDTWNGMMSQLSTTWTLLQKDVGDTGFFDKAKDGLRDFITLLQSDDALRFAQVVGDGLSSAIDLTREAGKFMKEYGSDIKAVAKAFLALYAGAKVMGVLSGAIRGVSALLGGSFVSRITAAGAATRTITERFGLMNLQVRTVTQTVGGLARISGVLGVVLAAMGGPWVVLAGLVAAGAAAYALFADQANESLQKVIDKGRELNEKGEIKIKLVTWDQIDEARKGLADLRQEKIDLDKELADMESKKFNHPIVNGPDFTEKFEEAKRRRLEIAQEIANAEQNIADSQAQTIKRNSEKSVTDLEKEMDKKLSATNQMYQDAVDLARKSRDQELEIARKAGADETSIMAKFVEEQTAAAIEQTNVRIGIFDDEIAKKTQQLNELIATNKNAENLMQIKSTIEFETINKEALLQDIERLKDALAKAAPEDKPLLKKQLEEAQTKLKETEGRVKELGQALDDIRGIDKSIIDADGIAGALDFLRNKVAGLRAGLDNLRDGKVDASVLIDFSAGEDVKKMQEKYESLFNAVKTKNAQLRAEVEEGGKGDVAKLEQKFNNIAKNPSELTDADREIAALKARNASAQEIADTERRLALSMEADNVKLKTKKELMDELAEATKKANVEETKFSHLKDNKNSSYDPTDFLTKRAAFEKSGATKEELADMDRLHAAEVRRFDAAKQGEERLREARSKAKDAAREAEAAAKKAANDAQRRREHEAKDILRREKWLNGQINKLQTDVRQAEIASMQQGTAVYQAEIDARIDEVRRLAAAEAEATGLNGDIAKDFVNRTVDKATPLINREAELGAASNFYDRMRDIDQDIFDAKNDLIEDGLQADRNALEQRFAMMELEAEREIQIEEDKQAYLSKLNELKAVEYLNVEKAHRSAIEQMMAQHINFTKVAGDAEGVFVDGMLDGMAEMAVTGKANFAEFALSVIQDASKMIVKMYLLSTVQAMVKGMGFFADGGVAPQEGAGLPVAAYANGGVPFMSQRELQRGGVKNSPQLALFAEASMPEAFIPMQDGKNIPLMMSRDSHGNLVGSIPLPSGEILPTRMVNANMKTFAKGGVMGAVSSPVTFGASADNIMPVLLSIDRSLAKLSGGVDSALFDRIAAVPDITVAEGSRRASGESAVQAPVVGGQSNANVEINITVQKDGSVKESAAGDENTKWAMLAKQIKTVVQKEIADQQRPGGSLYAR